MFLVALFFFKNRADFQGEVEVENSGLSYNTETLGNLINKDSDQDGVLDWEEGLWGTDPTKRDTDMDGVPDKTEIDGLKRSNGQNIEAEDLSLSYDSETGEENLTETDKFSREFFATTATLNENGQLDAVAMEQLGQALAEHIKNSPQKKIFISLDIKIGSDNSVQGVKKYNDSMETLEKKYPIKYNILDILQRFVLEENTDSTVLAELHPITEQLQTIITDIVKIEVPPYLVNLHLNFVNGMQKVSENLDDIQMYEKDVILALSGISQYDQNVEALQSATLELANAVEIKLNN